MKKQKFGFEIKTLKEVIASAKQKHKFSRKKGQNVATKEDQKEDSEIDF